jgi:hypothetical protein
MMTAQRQENKMEIELISKEETSYVKEIIFTHNEEKYEVLLNWDSWSGYDITFKDREAPEWAVNWEDNNEESLAFTLDTLTDRTLEESYL